MSNWDGILKCENPTFWIKIYSMNKYMMYVTYIMPDFANGHKGGIFHLSPDKYNVAIVTEYFHQTSIMLQL